MDTDKKAISRRLPPWLKKRASLSDSVHGMKQALRLHGLHTVCEEARCPNMGECFRRGTATIMIMGDLCTRNCRFCAVSHGTPTPLDLNDPGRVAGQISKMGLKHAVVTSVTRDDLPDGGASHFAQTVRAIIEICPETTVEVLTPDFEGRERDIGAVLESRPHVFNHNIETVERLTDSVRCRASYQRSLGVLKTARRIIDSGVFCAGGGSRGRGLVKSGIMVGLGESDMEIETTLTHLADAGADIVTIGQYLRPSKDELEVARYVEPETFREYEKIGLKLGIKQMFCGPFVRSSYLADKAIL